MVQLSEFMNKSKYPVLEIQEGVNFYNKLVASLPKNDEDLEDLLDMFLHNVTDYAKARGDWYLMKQSERNEFDETRTRYHESLLGSYNYIKRYLETNNQDVSFFKVIENEDKVIERKLKGDCACIIYALMGVMSR